MTDTTTIPATVAVAVESGWWSKINWTQAVGFASTGMTLVFGYKYAIPADTQLSIVAAIQSVQAVLTWVLKTWFTKTVTPSSVAQATTTTLPQQTLVHLS